MMQEQSDYLADEQRLVRLREAIDKRQEIITQLQEWRISIGDLILEEFQAIVSESDLEEIANEIYWQDTNLPTATNISVKGLVRDAFQAVTGKRFKPSKALEVACPACGGMVIANSVSALKEAEEDVNRTWPNGKALTIARLCCNDCYQLALEHVHRPSNVLMYPNPFIHENVSMPYHEFLNTDYWKQVKEFIKQRDGGECVLCGSHKELHVHHKNYYHRGYEFKKDLHTLCGNCHAKFHNKERGS